MAPQLSVQLDLGGPQANVAQRHVSARAMVDGVERDD
jgi:hypothetical protein